jgi:hypothetical protein
MNLLKKKNKFKETEVGRASGQDTGRKMYIKFELQFVRKR